MAWPTVAVDTTGMDNDTDALPRSAILDLTTKFNDLIVMRGVASGVCDLDGAGLVPVARIPAAIARLASPALSGDPTAPTQALRNNSTRLATTAFVLANGLLNGVLTKTAAYAMAAADYGKLVDATTGTWALTMNPATLGANFAFAARNSGTGVVTLTPSAGTIDGAASLALNAGESCLVFCDGTNFETVGRASTNVSTGQVAHFAMNTAPAGWLKANGAAVSRTSYAALFAAIGTTFGVGDGSTTFNLPDLRGEFLRGWDDGRGVDSGRVFGSAQAGAVESHTHTVGYSTNNGVSATNLTGATDTSISDTHSKTSAAAGGTETRPRNIALLACIKY